MSSEFDALTTFADWSGKLAELIAAARAASDGDAESRLAVVRRLTEFVAASEPGTTEIRQLDQIAAAAASELATNVAREASASLASRMGEFDSLAAQLDSIRSRTLSAQIPSAGAISELADRLATAADDAKAIVRGGIQAGGNSVQLQERIARLVATLSDLRAAFLAMSPSRPEPATKASGTVIPEGSRGTD